MPTEKANELSALLAKPTLERTVDDYESVFDDFVRVAGGARISEAFAIPDGAKSADYHFDRQRFEITLELKQLSAYNKANSVNQYWEDRLAEGKIKRFLNVSDNVIRIDRDSLSRADWVEFYKRFRPSVTTDLKKAAQQLKATEKFLPAPRTRRIKGVMLINTGDYNLPTDLLLRLVEWRMKREWKAGNFRSIDFVSCATIDMVRQGQHPLHARHIVRSLADGIIIEATRYVIEQWSQYHAAALGMTVTVEEDATPTPIEVELNRPFDGKIQWSG